MKNKYFEEERYLKAQKRVKEIKGFYGHLFWYVCTNIVWLAVLVYFNEVENSFNYGFWGMGYGLIANISLWGIGLFFHWFIVFGRHFTFSKSWEDRKIKEFMNKENTTK